jgi:hypothetical protein
MRRTALLLGPAAAVIAAAPALGAGAPTLLDGRWKATFTRAALVRTGEVSPNALGSLYGPWTASFAGGRFRTRNERTGGGGAGTFAVSGGRVRFVFATGIAVRSGSAAVCIASVYRGRLTFRRVPGRSCLGWDAAVWTRVG